jgi:hypothetical protein
MISYSLSWTRRDVEVEVEVEVEVLDMTLFDVQTLRDEDIVMKRRTL